MASHNRTPRSVLHAPKRELIYIHEVRGATRAQRRANAVYPNVHRRRGWSFAESYQTSNEPYRQAA